MKTTTTILLLFMLAACTTGSDPMTTSNEVTVRCLGGVEYYLFSEGVPYQGYGFMAVKYNRDGHVSMCD